MKKCKHKRKYESGFKCDLDEYACDEKCTEHTRRLELMLKKQRLEELLNSLKLIKKMIKECVKRTSKTWRTDMDKITIFKGIIQCLGSNLKEHLLIDLERISPLTNLRQETVFDELDWLEFQIELEAHFQIAIADDAMDNWKTVEDVINTVADVLEPKPEKIIYPRMPTRFEIITRDVDTLADFLFHITEDLPWFAGEERLERIKRFLQETP